MNPSMPTGWSWSCPCGWSTGRNRNLELVENARAGHLRWHDRLADDERTKTNTV